ncbi:hypothetical protein Cob_v002997 [Colletotrichum orbiculare MAFF 240422]|uniref:Uncharacterized protein n=1 Tax=Colletotrichum orbiculare (strain 104-T / ATCC 96160 / CBS 514.97 / LARS 414 / MAFF 240422) TaxID=1213857 RepID=A0A484G170_COLOR|nr:hypothetical protein Cob_v002997 [Colletotrichum orbiculare MAFF 240422]
MSIVKISTRGDPNDAMGASLFTYANAIFSLSRRVMETIRLSHPTQLPPVSARQDLYAATVCRATNVHVATGQHAKESLAQQHWNGMRQPWNAPLQTW